MDEYFSQLFVLIHSLSAMSNIRMDASPPAIAIFGQSGAKSMANTPRGSPVTVPTTALLREWSNTLVSFAPLPPAAMNCDWPITHRTYIKFIHTLNNPKGEREERKRRRNKRIGSSSIYFQDDSCNATKIEIAV